LTVDLPTTPDIPASPDLAAVLDELAAEAAERELNRDAPYAAVRSLARAGIGTLRLPIGHGGPGGSLRDLFGLVIRLAAADPAVAQALRAHFHFVEGRLAAAEEWERERWFPEVLRGVLVGNATVERHTADIFGFETTVTRHGDAYLLRGTKYYSTGSLYCDRVAVAAKGEDGRTISAIVPADREGVTLEDDWDGMGQRLSASGTSRFDDVLVREDELLPTPINSGGTTPRSAFLQLYLVAVAAGVVRAAAGDAAVVARGRTRTFSHAAADTPAADPLVQEAVGDVDVAAHVAETVVLAAADALDAAEVAGQEPESVHHAAVLAARAQVAVAALAPRAAERLFDAGGASATSRERNLDRHWRNVRTLASHNPAMYKARALGDLRINGTRLPANGFF
jgi:alkylation response protein AidB-like acyl-CoA dehydrogenase